MDQSIPGLFDKIRQQFDFGPYPRMPLAYSPKDDLNELYLHNLVTSFYLRDQRIKPTEKSLILDAGCGSGYKTLVLAEANPGATIIGIDFSEKSIDLARQRLQYHGFDNVEFHVLAIQDLPQLQMQFDYINCDDVLYLFDDPAIALQAMRSVLKPEGIIRANLHSTYERSDYFRAQKLFKLMGLLDNNPEELEIKIAIETMQALKDQVRLKARTWTPVLETEEGRQPLLMNYLFQGDKGYTVPDLFQALQQVELEFISMTNWRHWQLIDLFQEPEKLPLFWEMCLPELSIEEQLHLFELLNPIHRLLDFWCGHSGQPQPLPVSEWAVADWEHASIQIHPQLHNHQVATDLHRCIQTREPFEISRHISMPAIATVAIDSSMAACLLPLWQGRQSMTDLVHRWLMLHPVDWLTLHPKPWAVAFEEVQATLRKLEVFLYVLFEKSS